MADKDATAYADASAQFLEPLKLLGKSFILFLDVATLMPRMLFNTMVHRSPHGKTELNADLREGRRDRED